MYVYMYVCVRVEYPPFSQRRRGRRGPLFTSWQALRSLRCQRFGLGATCRRCSRICVQILSVFAVWALLCPWATALLRTIAHSCMTKRAVEPSVQKPNQGLTAQAGPHRPGQKQQSSGDHTHPQGHAACGIRGYGLEVGENQRCSTLAIGRSKSETEPLGESIFQAALEPGSPHKMTCGNQARSGDAGSRLGTECARSDAIVCVCVYLYNYIYIYIHTHTCVYIYIYIYIHLFIFKILRSRRRRWRRWRRRRFPRAASRSWDLRWVVHVRIWL